MGDGTYYAAVRLGHTSAGGRRVAGGAATARRPAAPRDATLHEPPGPQPGGKRGPKPKKGRREPSLKARLDDPKSKWQTVGVPWYGGGEKTLEMMTGTSLWWRTGEDPLPIRWVLLRCPRQQQQSFSDRECFVAISRATPIRSWAGLWAGGASR